MSHRRRSDRARCCDHGRLGASRGGVCALPPFRNPIDVARAVMMEGRHVLYAGEGAAAFARRGGFEPSTVEAMSPARARLKWEVLHKGALPLGSVPTGPVEAARAVTAGLIPARAGQGAALGRIA